MIRNICSFIDQMLVHSKFDWYKQGPEKIVSFLPIISSKNYKIVPFVSIILEFRQVIMNQRDVKIMYILDQYMFIPLSYR
ncbi:hypothetical protein DERP_005883 [Dermatophagoides pteronyssinus]|uniref:Uncharacterized protein n=1 Tax=Dermatophagoides pteronyssinus TaxID=6956 RepID=A0ABQ8J9U6_DERPT|nr:hypothetical protein DERP_005883 [Dermatophagoides pteronyssinus]